MQIEELEVLCANELGAPLARVMFEAGFLNNVVGVELSDGRRLVVKEHETSGGLEAVLDARRHISDGNPWCPRVLAVVGGRIVVEDFVADGAIPDPRDPQVRDGMAALLARLVATGAPDTGLVGVPWTDYRNDTYATPPGPPVDFEGTKAGVEWVDELAFEAAARLRASTEPRVVGHADWQAQNLRFDGARPVAVFDWDSLIADAESAIVGFAAAMFVDTGDPAQAESATPDEWLAFVDAYERRREVSLDRRLVASASVWVMAYMARWVHAYYPSDPPHYPGTHLGMLYRHGTEYLSW